MAERLVQAAQNHAELFVVSNELTNIVNHTAAFWIHVTTSFAIYTVDANDWCIIVDIATTTDAVVITSLHAIRTGSEERL